MLRAPDEHTLHLPWVRAAKAVVNEIDLSELFALVPVRGPTVDFLAPPPMSPLPEFGAELEVVRRTPRQRVIAELREHAVASGVGDAAAVIRYRRVEDGAALGQAFQRADLVGAHQPAVAFHVRRDSPVRPSGRRCVLRRPDRPATSTTP